jgi:hypothetical protein
MRVPLALAFFIPALTRSRLSSRSLFHILLTVRLPANPRLLPRFMNSREMEEYCKPIQSALWDSAKSDDLIAQAASAVNRAVKGKFNRDTIRTEPQRAVVANAKK